MAAASSFEMPSFTVLGAPSTRSLASFRPRLVTSRTALITLILLGPAAVRTTANSVFSSAGAAAAAPAPAAPAITTGAAAAAETPRRSSSFFTRAAASKSDRPTIDSSNCCRSAICISIYSLFVVISLSFSRLPMCGPHARLTHVARLTTDNAIPMEALARLQTCFSRPDQSSSAERKALCQGTTLVVPYKAIPNNPEPALAAKGLRARGFSAGKLVLLYTLVDDDGQVAANRIQRGDQPLRRSIHQEQQLRVNLFLRRHVG